jgi:hypothetical protein
MDSVSESLLEIAPCLLSHFSASTAYISDFFRNCHTQPVTNYEKNRYICIDAYDPGNQFLSLDLYHLLL